MEKNREGAAARERQNAGGKAEPPRQLRGPAARRINLAAGCLLAVGALVFLVRPWSSRTQAAEHMADGTELTQDVSEAGGAPARAPSGGEPRILTGGNAYTDPYSAAAEGAAEAVESYFAAISRGASREAALLTGESDGGLFSLEALGGLPAPDAPGTITALPYLTTEGRVLFEVTYPAEGKDLRTWAEARDLDGWRITGAADTYGAGLDPREADFSVPLLSLNGESAGIFSSDGGPGIRRLLIPEDGYLYLSWQSGAAGGSGAGCSVTLSRGAPDGESLFSCDLQPGSGPQQSRDIPVSAGVYYATVTPATGDAGETRLTISLIPEVHTEREDNDTPKDATPVSLNTACSAYLSGGEDTDWFSFSLDSSRPVNVLMTTSGTGSGATAYICTVCDAEGESLAVVSVPGSARISETGNLDLTPGEYYVQVTEGPAATADEYALTVIAP